MSEPTSNEVEKNKPLKPVKRTKKPNNIDEQPIEQQLSDPVQKFPGLKLDKIIVQLNRFAMKYIDSKGMIAQTYYSKENSVNFTFEPTITQIPSLSEVIRIYNKDRSRTVYVSFDKFVYEKSDIISDIQYLPNEITRWAKDIDQALLNVQTYDRWGVRVFYQIKSKDFLTLTMKNLLKLEQDQISRFQGKFDPNALNLRFTGSLKDEGLDYFLSFTNFAQDAENNSLLSPSDQLLIDIDFFRTNIKGLTQLQGTIQSAITLSEVLIIEFLEGVLRWQEE